MCRTQAHTTGFPELAARRVQRTTGPAQDPVRAGQRVPILRARATSIYNGRWRRSLGKSLDVFLAQAVLEPLGMTRSSFVWRESYETNHATPHDMNGKPREKWRRREPQAAGTLQTTATDYARFLRALVNTGGPPVPLGETTVDQMLTKTSTIDEKFGKSLGWSLGWGIESAPEGDYFWQWGDDGPFKAFAAGSRSTGTAVVVFANGHWGLDVARPDPRIGPSASAPFSTSGWVNYRPKGH